MHSEVEVPDKVVEEFHHIEEYLRHPVFASRLFCFPLVDFSPRLMSGGQLKIKRGMDIIISLVAIIILIPVYIVTAICIRLSSGGPVLYKQQRIGLNGKPFQMIKFRTMYQDSEKNGPQLSSKNDPRITRFGKLLRKVRLDEIPQLFTVLQGKMSLVGPRPEREFYIDQIVEKAPHYIILLKVKPGITSWGQIKYGYAENISQMLERLKFDLDYMEKISILTDVKVLLNTVFVIFQASGR
ncbi:MAG: sugar transferase [Bacteroidota bacterium]|nr:sugar transferase [Bacteroidota bacterium]